MSFSENVIIMSYLCKLGKNGKRKRNFCHVINYFVSRHFVSRDTHSKTKYPQASERLDYQLGTVPLKKLELMTHRGHVFITFDLSEINCKVHQECTI